MSNKEDRKGVAAIKTIKLNTKLYNLTALLVIFTIMLVIINSVTSLVDYIPKYSIVAMLAIVSILVVLNYHLSRKVAANAIQKMQDYEKKIENLAATMKKNLNSKKPTQEELGAMSLMDELTGLHRYGFIPLAEQYLKPLSRTNSIAYILFANIDNMEHINNTYGHLEGDYAIKTVADILKYVCRRSNLVARIGDDKFVALPIGSTESEAALITGLIQEKFDEFNSSAGKDYTLSISCGVAEYNPKAPCSVKDLLARSKHNLQEHKREKQNA